MKVRVNVYFNKNENTQTSWGDSTLPEEVNVSHGENILTGYYSGYKGFQFSSDYNTTISTLDGTYRSFKSNGYNGFISRTLANASGNINLTFSFLMSGDIPEHIYIQFDKVSKEYAVNFTLSNDQNANVITVTNNEDTLVELNFSATGITDLGDGVTFTLNVTKINKPYGSLKITRLSPYYIGVYTGTDLIDIKFSENLLDSNLSIQPGYCEQYADITLYDRDNMIHKFALDDKLSDQLYKVDIFVVDDGVETLIGNYVTNNWDIKATSSEVKLRCTDYSYVLNSILYTITSIQTRTVDDMLNSIFTQANMSAKWKYNDTYIEQYCKSIETPNSWFYVDTLRKTLDKVCNLGLIRVYWKDNYFIVDKCW